MRHLLLSRWITLARSLLGFIFFINGLNWFWKLLPYPSLHDPRLALTPPFVQALLDTGFMFALVRVIELGAGLALLADLYVPLTLVVVFPITVIIWLVDVFLLGTSVRAQVMGWAVLLLNSLLLVAFIDVYRPMLVRRTSRAGVSGFGLNGPVSRGSLLVLGALANLIGVIAVLWLCEMMVSRLRAPP